MIESYFVKPSTVDRIRGSWLGPEIERYVDWMASQGYAVRNVYRRVPILCQFAEFAKLHGSTDAKSATSHIEEFAAHWLASHGSKCSVPEARSKIAEEARNPVRQMLRLALDGRVAAARTRKSFRSTTRHLDFCVISEKNEVCVRRRFIIMCIVSTVLLIT